MPHFDHVLAVTMVISCIWGIVVLSLGLYMRFNFGQMVSAQLEGIEKFDLRSCKNSASQSVCPVTSMVPNNFNLGNWVKVITNYVVLTGSLVTVYSIIGTIGALKHNVPMITMFLLISLVATGFQFYLVQVATSEENGIHQTAKSQLKNTLNHDYRIEGPHDIVKVMNTIHILMDCCGIDSVRDFKNLTFLEKDPNSKAHHFRYFATPPSCCKQRFYFCTSCPRATYDNLLDCAVKGPVAIENINTRGCYSVMYEHVKNTSGLITLSLLLFIIVWEMLQMMLALSNRWTLTKSSPLKSGDCLSLCCVQPVLKVHFQCTHFYLV
ncbi:tetraspanin-18 [Biomphalaria glabrata]|nr:tetraspanin-18-like [Biomphalaria glabrata]